MSYSCVDFVDDLLGDFAIRGIIDGDKIPNEDPQAQADLCFAGIGRVMAERSALLEALRDIRAAVGTFALRDGNGLLHPELLNAYDSASVVIANARVAP